jgi:hypothetical protein
MKTMKQITVACVLLLAFTVMALGQVTNAVPPTDGPVVTNPAMVNLWNGLIVLVVPLVVLGIKKVLPMLPKLTWPIAATLLGVGADWLLSVAGAIPTSSWEVGALCGAAGIGLREATKQVLALVGGSDTPAAPKPPGS